MELVEKIKDKTGIVFIDDDKSSVGLPQQAKPQIIPPARVRYLAEIADTIEKYDIWANEQSEIATKLYQLNGTIDLLEKED